MTGTATVHLVDDDPALLRSLGRLVAAAGHRTMTHACATQFFDRFDGEAAGCVVLDRRMPGVDGDTVQGWLTERRACLPVIFLTSKDDEIDEVLGLRMGADDYVKKPFSQRLLVERIRALLRRQDAVALEQRGDLFAVQRVLRGCVVHRPPV